jgi:hypothetical protein
MAGSSSSDLGTVGKVSPAATIRLFVRVAVAVAARPRLWRTGLRELRRVARPGWVTRPPFLPLPDPGWLTLRLELAYGVEPSSHLRVDDVVEWLEWCREHDAAAA